MEPFEFQLSARVIFGPGCSNRLGELAHSLRFRRTLLVADGGLLATGHVDQAIRYLTEAGIETVRFHDFHANPTTEMVAAGCAFAAQHKVDSIIGLGGGSSLDCAKGINLLLTNGGRVEDYVEYGKARRPLLPMIGTPTTAGTGSEAQSYALISDANTHAKLACGDPQATFRVVVLDPLLTVSQPAEVTAAAGFDAIAHAVETYVTTKRNFVSRMFSRTAWQLLERNYERVLSHPDDLEARGAMQLGAYFSGLAIENSMLGATHACANPLTARYGTAHGAAIAMLLPAVVRWNSAVVSDHYSELLSLCGNQKEGEPGEALAFRLEQLAGAGGLRVPLRDAGVAEHELPLLAAEAARQWTGGFNPRQLDQEGALEVYRCAY